MQLFRRALARPSALALVLGTFLSLFITLPAAYGHLIVDQKGTISPVAGSGALKMTEYTVSTVAILAGGFWFAQRTWDAISA